MPGTSNVGLIGVTLFADSTKFAQNMRSAAKETKDFMKAWQRAVKETGGGAIPDRAPAGIGGGGGTPKETEKDVRSLIQSFNALRQATGVGVIALAGRTFANVTERIQEMRFELSRGRATVNDFIISVSSSLPIIGGFAAGLSEIYTGNIKRELDELTKSLKNQEGAAEAFRKLRQLASLETKSGLARSEAAINAEYEDRIKLLRAAQGVFRGLGGDIESALGKARDFQIQLANQKELERAAADAKRAAEEQKRLNDERAKFQQSLRDEAEQISEIQKLRREAERLGLAADPATQALIAQVARTKELKEAMAEANAESERLWSRAQQLIDETATPTERLRKELAEIAKLRAGNFIGDQTAARASEAAQRRFRDAAGGGLDVRGGGLPAGLEFGGAGAIAAEARFIAGQNQAVQIDRDQLRQLERMERTLTVIERNTRSSTTAAASQGFP